MRLRASTFLFFLCGAALAFLLASFRPGNDAPGSTDAANDIDALHLAELGRRIDRLETAMAELGERVARLRSAGAEAVPAIEDAAPAVGPPLPAAAMPSRAVEVTRAAARLEAMAALTEELAAGGPTLASKLERLGGFSAERARAIADRVDELMVEAMDYQTRTGIPSTPLETNVQRERHIGRALRGEIGDADYERYRVASGLPTAVPVSAVEPDSIAERAGILPGDVIVAHDGRRVMDLSELEDFIAQGAPGTNALIDVVRSGRPMQFYVPRGPLGVIEVSAFGARMRDLEAERKRITERSSSSQ